MGRDSYLAPLYFSTRLLYRWIKGKNAPSLGISLSFRRLIDLLVGLLIGFVLIISPYAFALWTGTATIYDRITAHFDNFTVARIISVAFFLLLLQSVMGGDRQPSFPDETLATPLTFVSHLSSIDLFCGDSLSGRGY